MTDPNCPICGGEGWVCENHTDVAWDGGSGHGADCNGAGQLCVCNPQPYVNASEAEKKSDG